ncbi:hypothetical protein AB0J80_37590 [Actinoplanes sp. NPDC049548]|uniref:hypothetical protein n=1 Tax=Actinoplanes sp. NPDC049548 TaxID=3155152 RepID=UPI00342F42E5
MTRRSRRTETRRRAQASAGTQEYRYYVHVVDEWGLDKPLSVFRLRGEGCAAGEEEVAPGAVWKPTKYALERANRTAGYSAVPVDADTANRLAARWAYTYQRIVERSSGRTVAYTRSWILPSGGMYRFEDSTCRSAVWESTRRLWRIDTGIDDYDVEAVEAATVEEYLRDLPRVDYRYFAVVNRHGSDFSLNDPADVLRVTAGQESGVRERLGVGWEPYHVIDGVRGLRDETLLEIDDAAVAAFRRRYLEATGPSERDYTYYALLNGGVKSVNEAQQVVRQWRTSTYVQEEELRGGPHWVRANNSGRETRATNPKAVEISLETVEQLKAPWRYTYYEILRPDTDQPMAVVRHYGAYGGREEAAVGWPVWSPSLWLKQIAEGTVSYRARQVDADAVERYLRRAAAELPEYRYFAFLRDRGDSIDSAGHMARMHCRENGDPWKEETPQKDGGWAQTHQLLEINHGKGSWWIEPVEVPRWLFERYRAERQGNASAG